MRDVSDTEMAVASEDGLGPLSVAAPDPAKRIQSYWMPEEKEAFMETYKVQT